MKTIVLSDTHFGVKNNSTTWLKSQLDGLDEIINYIVSSGDNFDIVHCGDLFDSRSSINPYIVREVQSKLTELATVVDKFIILGGNHDYYSPMESDYNITSLDFLKLPKNVYIVTQEFCQFEDITVIPWFEFHNADRLLHIVKQLSDTSIIYTHTDLGNIPADLNTAIRDIDIPIISGHIHIPDMSNSKRLTIGNCYALNFLDANSTRGFYVLENNDVSTIQFHELKNPIRFYRIYNNKIFEFDTSVLRQIDKLEIYLDSQFYTSEIYRNKIEELQKCCDTNIIINATQELGELENIRNFDIEDIILDTVPEHLKKKFDILKCHITSNN